MNPNRLGRRNAIRRATTASFTPASIPGLALWLDASQLTGIADGGTVQQLNDLSGNGRHAIQSTAAARPTLIASGTTRTPTGRSYLAFDGGDDFMTGPLFTGAQPVTTFTVLARRSSPYTQVDFDLRPVGGSGGFLQRVGEGAGAKFNLYAGETAYSSADAPTAWSVNTVRWNTTASSIRIDGSTQSGLNVGTQNVTGGYVLGRYGDSDGGKYQMSFAAMLVYSGALTDAQVTQVEAYLRDRFIAASSSGSTSWSGGSVSARQASALADFWAVCTHFKYPAYSGRKAAVAQLIYDAGIRIVRDGWGYGSGDEDTASQALLDKGLKLMATHSPEDTGGTETRAAIQAIADAHARRLGSSLIAVEGWNEPGGFNGYANDASLKARVVQWQAWLFDVYRKTSPYQSIPVGGPSLADSNTAAKWSAADLTAYADRATSHDYPGNSYAMVDSDFARFKANGNLMVNRSRIATSETGMTNGGSDSPFNVPDAAASGIIIPRVQWEHFRLGWEQSATYEFLNEGTDQTYENNFGLVNNDLTPKPAYTTIKNTLNLLADPGAAFTPTALPMSIGGASSATRNVLLQKRDGSYWLIVWEQVQVWNGNGGRSPSVSVPLTLTFDRSRTVAVYDPHTSSTATGTSTGTSATVSSTEKTTIVKIT